MGEAHAILESQTLPHLLVELAGTAATKVAPKGGLKAKGKAAAEHVKAKPAATKPKAVQPTAKHVDPDDRIFSIQSSIESIRETQEMQASSLKGIDAKLDRVSAKLTQIEKCAESTAIVLQGFAAILTTVQANTTKATRKPKAA